MRDCLVEIEHLSAAGPGDRRSDILRRVTDLFLITADRQTPADRQTFGDVLSRLANGVSADDRAELAERLADAPTAPGSLIRELARDDIQIARPVLQHSPCLSDADLIDLAAAGGPAVGAAISRRAHLNNAVTDLLAESGDDTVLMRMAANPNATFSVAGFEVLTARAADRPELRRTLLERRDLPAAFATRLRADARDASGHGEARHGEPLHDEFDWEIEPPAAAEGTDAPYDDDGLFEDEPVTESTRNRDEAHLAELARAGRLEETIASLSKLTGFAPPLVENCLLSAEAPALVVLCKAHFIGSTTFSALLQLRQAADAISPKGIASAMRRYETMDPYMAQRIMRFLRVRLAQPIKS